MNAAVFCIALGFLLLVAVIDLALRPPEKRRRPLWIPFAATVLFLGALMGVAYLIGGGLR